MKLIVKNLKKNFGKKEVLKDINFEFEKGKIYGLLGRNGAGNYRGSQRKCPAFLGREDILCGNRKKNRNF